MDSGVLSRPPFPAGPYTDGPLAGELVGLTDVSRDEDCSRPSCSPIQMYITIRLCTLCFL